MLWHHFAPDTISVTGKKERHGVAGNDPSEWQRSVLVTKEHQLYLEPSYIFGAIRDGARHTPRKRGTLQSYISATLQVTDDKILVDRFLPADKDELLAKTSDDEVYLDIRSVKNPARYSKLARELKIESPKYRENQY